MQDKHRRKSLSIFKPTLSGLAPIRDNSNNDGSASSEGGRAAVLRKKIRPLSLINSQSSASSPLPLRRADSNASQQSIPSPALRNGRPSSKSRPSSIFGSIKSIHSLQSYGDDDSSVGNSTTRTSWGTNNGDVGSMLDPERMVLLHHGEVSVGGGMFRRKNQYLVLTNTHLIRFKSQAKASELFPGLSPPSSSSGNEGNGASHLRKPSNSSIAEISTDDAFNVPVRQIVAAYKLEEGKESKSSNTVEIAYVDETTNSASTMHFQSPDEKEMEQWLLALKGTVAQTRSGGSLPYSKKAIEYVARTLENDGDYDPQHFHMYTVVQREKKSSSLRSSSDDLGKLLSSISYLVIGYYKMHLIPLLRPTKSSSSTSISDLAGSSYGLAALSSFVWSGEDDTFQLGFRLPMQSSTSLYLASACSDDIGSKLRQALDHLRPLYIEQPLSWSSAPIAESKPPSPAPIEFEDHLGFDRTLTAYCVAYKLDPSNVRYTVNYYGEDTPEFQLLEPANPSTRTDYSVLELLAIFRALRYNDSFNSLSFNGIKLDALHGVVDRLGSEHLCWKTKTGQALDRPHAGRLSLLVQEVQNLAVQNERLRRIDFGDCLSHSRSDTNYMQHSGTEIVEALMPLCSQRLTNIDWIVLNGLALSELDVSCLYSASLKRGCEFRAIEMGGCALGFDGLRIVAEGMQTQNKTIECINVSASSLKLDEGFIASLAPFKTLRQLDLSRCQSAVGGEAFLPAEILSNWRLESLRLSDTPLTQVSIDSLAVYLEDNQSSNLRELLLSSCRLNGRDVATLLRSIAANCEEPRKMMVDVSRNRIAQDSCNEVLACISESETPEHLVMKNLEFGRESDFKDFIEAVTENESLKYLDISGVSLPYDASPETCESLHDMFEKNDTLEELNISGELATLEAATIGKGLPGALKGLATNSSLRVLHCNRQALGLPGAAALAHVLEQNYTLQELHCEDNEISLQAFTALVNALERNKTLLYLPTMHNDRKHMTEKVNREVNAILNGNSTGSNSSSSSSRSGYSIRRSVTGLASYRPSASFRSSSTRSLRNSSDRASSTTSNSSGSFTAAGYTEQDIAAAVTKFDDSWDAETDRMQALLLRNAYLSQGLGPDGGILEEARPSFAAVRIPMTAAEAGFVLPPVSELGESRPPTAGSLAAAIAKASLDRTPTAEFDRQLGHASKATIDTSVVERTLVGPGLDGESPSLDTPIQAGFAHMFGNGDDGEALLVMGAR